MPAVISTPPSNGLCTKVPSALTLTLVSTKCSALVVVIPGALSNCSLVSFETVSTIFVM